MACIWRFGKTNAGTSVFFTRVSFVEASMDVSDAFRGMGTMRLCGKFTVTRALIFGVSERGGYDNCSGSLYSGGCLVLGLSVW